MFSSRNLVENFVVCGVSSDGLRTVSGDQGFVGTNVQYEANVLDWLPQDEEAHKIPLQLPTCCLPNGVKILLKNQAPHISNQLHFYTIILTEGDGRSLYASCLGFYDDIPAELCARHFELVGAKALKLIILLSHKPYLCTFHQVLQQLYDICFVRGPASVLVHIINYLLRIPIPAEDGPPVVFSIGRRQFTLQPTSPYGPPAGEISLQPLAESLTVDQVMSLMLACMLERRVLLRSSEYWLLSLVGESIRHLLLYPLAFQHVYVPIVPYSLVTLIEAPTPWLMGLHSSVQLDHRVSLDGVLQVDLDRNTVTGGDIVGGDALLSGPAGAKLRSRLRSLLQPSLCGGPPGLEQWVGDDDAWQRRAKQLSASRWSQAHQELMQAVLLQFFRDLLDGYHRFLKRGKGPNDSHFDANALLHCKAMSITDAADAPLLKQLLQTNSFEAFIEEQSKQQDCYAWYTGVAGPMAAVHGLPVSLWSSDSVPGQDQSHSTPPSPRARTPQQSPGPTPQSPRTPAPAQGATSPDKAADKAAVVAAAAVRATAESLPLPSVSSAPTTPSAPLTSSISAPANVLMLPAAFPLEKRPNGLDTQQADAIVLPPFSTPALLSPEGIVHRAFPPLLSIMSPNISGTPATRRSRTLGRPSGTHRRALSDDQAGEQRSANVSSVLGKSSQMDGRGSTSELHAEAELQRRQSLALTQLMSPRSLGAMSPQELADMRQLLCVQTARSAWFLVSRLKEMRLQQHGAGGTLSLSSVAFPIACDMLLALLTTATFAEDWRTIMAVLELAAVVHREWPGVGGCEYALYQLGSSPLVFCEGFWQGVMAFQLSSLLMSTPISETITFRGMVAAQLPSFAHYITAAGVSGPQAWMLLVRLAGQHMRLEPADAGFLLNLRAQLACLDELAAELDEGAGWRQPGDVTAPGLGPRSLASQPQGAILQLSRHRQRCRQPLLPPGNVPAPAAPTGTAAPTAAPANVARHQPHTAAVTCTEVVGQLALTASLDGSARLFRLQGSGIQQSWAVTVPGGYSAARQLPRTGRVVLAEAATRQLQLLDMAKGRVTGRLTGHDAAVTCITPMGASGCFCSGDANGVVLTWDARAGGAAAASTLQGHMAWISAVSAAPSNDHMLASGSRDCTVRVWDTRKAAEPLHVLSQHSDWVTTLTWCQTSSPQLLSASYDWSARVWDATTGTCSAVLLGHSAAVTQLRAVYWQQSGWRVLAGAADGVLGLWELSGGELLAMTRLHTGGIQLLAATDVTLVTGGDDGSLALWELEGVLQGGRPLPLASHSCATHVASLGMCTESLQLLAGGTDGSLTSWHCQL